jgi:hypothetical protein
MHHVRRAQAVFNDPGFVKTPHDKILRYRIRVVTQFAVGPDLASRLTLVEPKGQACQKSKQSNNEDLAGPVFHFGSR